MQREARDVMLKLGLVREGLTAHLMLAGYTHALGDEKAASAEYEAVRKAAATSELWALVSQAHLGMSGICMRQKDWNAAATHYTSAGHAAERGAAAGLAIEAWRLAGQLGLQVGAESQAAQCFQNALRVAEGTTASLQKVSSAPDAARTLAALCERRGLVAQARSLYEQADRYEHPFVQDAPMQDASVQRASVQDASDGRSA
jgi:tetratricopeptide (TPR) repeat protein